ncbi:MAG TPA: LysR substrate-binding domain-containing protein [Tepidisphaeraceae bacterium]|jgi:LysR family hydrogen peroxide-inducible transcriptional activator|nr:LysR substrate-binding domain-containing protein [Tepidisphaeraceae bacterium]
MNLRDLEYVLALAETGHFGAAATRCCVTQPTLSTQIARLEAELGVQIFERATGRVLVTPRGNAVVAQAGVVLDEVRLLRETGREASNFLAGRVTIGIIPTAGAYLLSHLLPLLKERHPRLRLYIREEMTASLLERLRHAHIDVAVLSRPIEDGSIQSEPIYVEPFVAALPPDHSLAKHNALEVDQLSGEKLLVLQEGHCMKRQAQAICRRLRGSHDEAFEISGIETLRQMVSGGIGCTLMPYLSTIGPFAATVPVAYRHFRTKPPSRTLVLAWRHHFPFGTALRELAKILRSELPGMIAGESTCDAT